MVGKLIALVRIHVPLTVCDRATGVIRQVTDHVWDHVARNHKDWHSKEVKPLYMTRRYLEDDTSLIIEVDSPDALASFLTKNIATIDEVRGIWVINMAKMRFFKTPMEHHPDLSRFTITIDAIPRHMDDIYESISALRPGRDIIINYVAHTFQSPTASIMVSVLARSINHMNAFVDGYIRPLAGVVGADITYISKTMRLASPKEWKESLGPYFVTPAGDSIKDIDVDDDTLIAGC